MTSSPMSPALLMHDPAFAQFKDQLIETTGLAYYANQEDELAGRIAGRLTVLEMDQLSAYLSRLSDGNTGEAEWDALIAELTIGETSFFRHREQFDALRDQLLPELIERNRHRRRLRIWSAGCATGAEPYSIAILLGRDLAHLVSGWDLTIVGTDINREFLNCAQRGEFAEWAFRSGSEEVKESCFSPTGKRWAIKPEYKRSVSFQYHNLVQHAYPCLPSNLSDFDLILCRNVMIYFNPGIVPRIIGQLYDCLVDGGWILVGHAESSVELFRSFRTVNVPGAVLYQKAAPPAVLNRSIFTGLDWNGTSGLPNSQAPGTLRPAMAVEGKDEKSKHPPIAYSGTRRPLPWSQPLPERLAIIRAKADRAEWQEAARCCDELIATDRLNPTAHFFHALVLEQMGQHIETEKALRRTIYLDRQFVLAHYHLGLLLQKKLDVGGAERSFRNTIRLLDQISETQALPDADGLTAGALKQLTKTHLEVLCRS